PLKYSFLVGEIIPKAGGTTNHNQIAGNFYRAFPLSINNRDYYTYINDVKLWIEDYGIYTYPDLMIIEDQPAYQSDNTTVVTNPKVIVEVLSDSTKNYDRTDKFRAYRSLASFQEYILISQSSYYLEQFSKQNNEEWLFKSIEGENNILSLTTIDFSIPLGNLYQRIVFANG
ncbi:MAG: Uma2 family endonuclease, partial [Sphaerospermopsis sp. SIO1G2]|nr:Uma2 family endonuclease [Sphaerospermopsis sp. SIO1G2]